MAAIMYIFIFALGSILGSFLNVFMLRYNTGKSIRGRSLCQSCGKTLHFYELVPLISFFFLRGRCHGCKSRISLQYPIVEALLGFLYVLIFMAHLPFAETAFMFANAWILIGIAIYDVRHYIVPDGLVFTFIGLSGVKLFFSFSLLEFTLPTLSFLLAGPIVALPIFLLWMISGGRLIGLGDAKLALGVGWLLGLSFGIAALALSFWIGALVSITLLIFQNLLRKRSLNLYKKHLTIKTEVPFAPFMIAGTFLVYLFKFNLSLFLIF